MPLASLQAPASHRASQLQVPRALSEPLSAGRCRGAAEKVGKPAAWCLKEPARRRRFRTANAPHSTERTPHPPCLLLQVCLLLHELSI